MVGRLEVPADKVPSSRYTLQGEKIEHMNKPYKNSNLIFFSRSTASCSVLGRFVKTAEQYGTPPKQFRSGGKGPAPTCFCRHLLKDFSREKIHARWLDDAGYKFMKLSHVFTLRRISTARATWLTKLLRCRRVMMRYCNQIRPWELSQSGESGSLSMNGK